jgi:DNA-binding response OmpR family regulator
MMPYKDGFTLASQIREADKSISMMFLTAKADIKDVRQGYASGGNDYLRKPFSLDELFLRVAELLRRSVEVMPSEDIKIGKYAFLQKRQELIGPDNAAVKLSYKEARLLELLFQSKNQVLDRKTTLMQLFYYTQHGCVYYQTEKKTAKRLANRDSEHSGVRL